MADEKGICMAVLSTLCILIVLLWRIFNDVKDVKGRMTRVELLTDREVKEILLPVVKEVLVGKEEERRPNETGDIRRGPSGHNPDRPHDNLPPPP